MAATAIHRLTLDPMGKCSNAFFSETTNIIKAKLYMGKCFKKCSLDGPLQSLCFLSRSEIQDQYKLYVFCSGMKFKMAATAGLSLTLDPMGKMFQNASSFNHLDN